MTGQDDNDRERLTRGAEALGAPLDAPQTDALLHYRELLTRWNRRFNLTAIRDPGRMIEEHLLDSLSVRPHLRGERIVDVGTGAGLPGMILALAEPERRFVLLDANGKKTRFLREAVRVLGPSNVTIVQQRVEDYRPAVGFDTVVCRAFAPLPRLLETAGHLCAEGGIVLAQKGRLFDAEIADVPAGWSCHTTGLDVPGLAKTRHLITLRPQHAP